MIIYILMLIIVLFFSHIIEKNKNNKKSIFYAVILLLILSIIAGLRSTSVGWDASKYVESTFYRLNYFNGSLKKFMDATSVEVGFSLYSYILYKIYPNINFLLFGYSFLTSLFIFLFAFKEKENLSISKLLIIYYLTLYLISYNIIRQTISFSIILLSFSFFKRKQYFKSLLLFMFGTFFHLSAALAIFLFVIYSILNSQKKLIKKQFWLFIILFLFLISCIFFSKIITLLYNLNIISLKYYNYFLNYDKGIDYNISNIAFSLFFIVFIRFAYTKSQKYKDELLFLLTIIIIGFMINVISIYIHPIYRVSYYYFYIGLFYLYPSIKNYMECLNYNNKKILKILIYFVLAFWFFWQIYLGNGHNLYPYVSNIFNWLH